MVVRNEKITRNSAMYSIYNSDDLIYRARDLLSALAFFGENDLDDPRIVVNEIVEKEYEVTFTSEDISNAVDAVKLEKQQRIFFPFYRHISEVEGASEEEMKYLEDLLINSGVFSTALERVDRRHPEFRDHELFRLGFHTNMLAIEAMNKGEDIVKACQDFIQSDLSPIGRFLEVVEDRIDKGGYKKDLYYRLIEDGWYKQFKKAETWYDVLCTCDYFNIHVRRYMVADAKFGQARIVFLRWAKEDDRFSFYPAKVRILEALIDII